MRNQRVNRDLRWLSENKRILTGLSVLGLILAAVSVGLGVHQDLFQRPEVLQAYLSRTGIFAPVIFFVLTILNAIYPFIPGGMGNVVGYLAFGPLKGFALAFSANVIGSLCLFYLARRYGTVLLEALFSPKLIQRAMGYLNKGYYLECILAVVYIVPGLPDDIFTAFAGLSKMKKGKFILLQLLCRPLTMYLYMMGINQLLALLATKI
ncbi:TVP38/TMEM64 family protein [Vaginisenegalia massiliensis]|uniref:TVP38/TMEM64 family protein n=1 Tax=Vaginisenegalia massiliensis TaxID=2058294 RepID=UPI000F52BB62|nr:VTT domain-containing protein [Vaginisenegalia massiliensis]